MSPAKLHLTANRCVEIKQAFMIICKPIQSYVFKMRNTVAGSGVGSHTVRRFADIMEACFTFIQQRWPSMPGDIATVFHPVEYFSTGKEALQSLYSASGTAGEYHEPL